MGVVEKKVAVADIEGWLEYKKIKPKKREEREEQIELLISEVEAGNLTVEDGFNLKYQLEFPIQDKEGNVAVSELDFKPRMNSLDLSPYLKGVKPQDADGRLTAHVSALTGKGSGMIKKLDTEDKGVAEAIALFFL